MQIQRLGNVAAAVRRLGIRKRFSCHRTYIKQKKHLRLHRFLTSNFNKTNVCIKLLGTAGTRFPLTAPKDHKPEANTLLVEIHT